MKTQTGKDGQVVFFGVITEGFGSGQMYGYADIADGDGRKVLVCMRTCMRVSPGLIGNVPNTYIPTRGEKIVFILQPRSTDIKGNSEAAAWGYEKFWNERPQYTEPKPLKKVVATVPAPVAEAVKVAVAEIAPAAPVAPQTAPVMVTSPAPDKEFIPLPSADEWDPKDLEAEALKAGGLNRGTRHNRNIRQQRSKWRPGNQHRVAA